MIRRSLVGLSAICVSIIAFYISSVVISSFYGGGTTTTVQTVTLENSAQTVTFDNVSYVVENVLEQENSYLLNISWENTPSMAPLPAIEGGASESPAPSRSTLEIPAEAYETAKETGEPVTVSTVTTVESKPIDVTPLAAILGIATGIATISIWIGYRQAWGEATSVLIERGLHDMSVKDVELLGYLMRKGEFTIPELMKLAKAPKLKVWRTVQRLIDEGLVVPTDRTKPAANGLGGRGKPSRIYRYVGRKSEPRESESKPGLQG